MSITIKVSLRFWWQIGQFYQTRLLCINVHSFMSQTRTNIPSDNIFLQLVMFLRPRLLIIFCLIIDVSLRFRSFSCCFLSWYASSVLVSCMPKLGSSLLWNSRIAVKNKWSLKLFEFCGYCIRSGKVRDIPWRRWPVNHSHMMEGYHGYGRDVQSMVTET